MTATAHYAPQISPGGPFPNSRGPKVSAAQIITWLAILITLALSVVALSVSLTNTSHAPTQITPSAPAYSNAEIAAAKSKACAAATRSVIGMRINTNRPGPTSPEDALGWANSANGRIAALTAATYVPNQLDPATPTEVRETAQAFASAAFDFAALGVEESDGVAYEKARVTVSVAAKEVERVCK